MQTKNRPAKKGGIATKPKSKLLRVDPTGPKVKLVPVEFKPKAAKKGGSVTKPKAAKVKREVKT